MLTKCYESLPLEKFFIQKVTNPLKLLINVLVLINKNLSFSAEEENVRVFKRKALRK